MAGKSLTKQEVEALIPGDRDKFLWCGEVAGFGVKVTPRGKRLFIVQYRNATRQTKRFSIGTFPTLTVAQARQRAKEVLAQVLQGDDPQLDRIEKRSGMTVSEFIEKYEEHVNAHLKPKTAREYKIMLKAHVLPKWGTKRLDAISHRDAAQLHHSMKDSPISANRIVAILRAAFGLAITWGYLVENPAIGIKPYREKPRERFLSQNELGRVFEILDKAESEAGYSYYKESTTTPGVQEQVLVRVDSYAAAAIRLLAMTGARRSEVLECEWPWVDMDRGQINLPDSKTGKKTVYLHSEAIEVLRKLYAIRTNEFLIPRLRKKKADAPDHYSGLDHVWKRVREAAGLPEVRLHDLRHSYASFLVARGLSLPIIGKMLGHRQPSTTARYSHLADDPLRAAAELVGTIMQEAQHQKKSG